MNHQSNQATIYIGLNDSETGVQKYDSQKYLSILKTLVETTRSLLQFRRSTVGIFTKTVVIRKKTP